MRADCARAEMAALLAALAGRFVAPGPAGAPARGRATCCRPGATSSPSIRACPTRTAWEIGQRAAQEVLTRYVQDHGEWPRALVLDLWGSATMRTGGDDLAQAFALIGVRPLWDSATTRVSGFEILPPARRAARRRDAAHFRPVPRCFPGAGRAVSRRRARRRRARRGRGLNPLIAPGRRAARVFGAAPGAYGVGSRETLRAAHGRSATSSAQPISTPRASPTWRGRSRRGARRFAARSRADALTCAGHGGNDARGRRLRRARRRLLRGHRALRGRGALTHLDLTRPGAAEAAQPRRGRARLRGRPPIRAGLPARCGTAIAARRRSPKRSTISSLSRRRRVASAMRNSISHRATLGDEEVCAFLERENPRALEAIAAFSRRRSHAASGAAAATARFFLGLSMTHMGSSARTLRRAAIKGWCPGALRPMQSGDGLSCARVRLGLTLAHAREIAGVARDYGNGRSIFRSAQSADARRERMLRPALEASRLRGLCCARRGHGGSAQHPGIAFGRAIPTPWSTSWAQAFARDAELRDRLPAKFGFSSTRRRAGAADVVADIRLELREGGASPLAGGAGLRAAVAFGGGAGGARLGARLPSPASRRRSRAGACARSRALGAAAVFGEAGLPLRCDAILARATARVIGARGDGAAWLRGARRSLAV